MPVRSTRFFSKRNIFIITIAFAVAITTGGAIGKLLGTQTVEKNRIAMLQKINQDRDWQMSKDQEVYAINSIYQHAYNDLDKSDYTNSLAIINDIDQARVKQFKLLDKICFDKFHTIAGLDLTPVTKPRFVSSDTRLNFEALQQNDKENGGVCHENDLEKASTSLVHLILEASVHITQYEKTKGSDNRANLALKSLLASNTYIAEIQSIEDEYGKSAGDFFRTALNLYKTFYAYINTTNPKDQKALSQALDDTVVLLPKLEPAATKAIKNIDQQHLESSLKWNLERYKLVTALNKNSPTSEFIPEQWSYPIFRAALQLYSEKHGGKYPASPSLKEAIKTLAEAGYIDESMSFGTVQYSLNSDGAGYTLTIPGRNGQKHKISTGAVPESNSTNAPKAVFGST